MKKVVITVTENEKTYKTYEEIRKSIKGLFENKGETLAEDKLERTVKAYVYLTDDHIPVDTATAGKN